jgi:membrane dipeptidase
MPLIFDAHLDLSLNALQLNRDLTLGLDELNAREKGMTDHRCREHAVITVPELRDARTAMCLATVLARWNPKSMPKDGFSRIDLDYATQEIAGSVAFGQASYYTYLEDSGHLRMVKTKAELEEHWDEWSNHDDGSLPVGYILAMEGSDPISWHDRAYEWYEAGLRVASLSHYGMSAYAGGTGTTEGLTANGKELLKQFDAIGIILDLSHLSDKSFDEALDAYSGPLLASHNNCRALVPGGRQFSDEQINRITDRGGIIGTSFDAWMLAKNWSIGSGDPNTVPLSAVTDHIDHICQLAGSSDHVALGTDLDGGFGSEQTPGAIKRFTDVQKIASLLSEREYSNTDIEKIFHGNWLEFFRKHLPDDATK